MTGNTVHGHEHDFSAGQSQPTTRAPFTPRPGPPTPASGPDLAFHYAARWNGHCLCSRWRADGTDIGSCWTPVRLLWAPEDFQHVLVNLPELGQGRVVRREVLHAGLGKCTRGTMSWVAPAMTDTLTRSGGPCLQVVLELPGNSELLGLTMPIEPVRSLLDASYRHTPRPAHVPVLDAAQKWWQVLLRITTQETAAVLWAAWYATVTIDLAGRLLAHLYRPNAVHHIAARAAATRLVTSLRTAPSFPAQRCVPADLFKQQATSSQQTTSAGAGENSLLEGLDAIELWEPNGPHHGYLQFNDAVREYIHADLTALTDILYNSLRQAAHAADNDNDKTVCDEAATIVAEIHHHWVDS